MKLEEKFKQWLDTNPRPELRDIECVAMADNHAIGFAEWCNSNYGFDVGSWVKYENGKFNRYSTKQLLEIYKQTL